ncbi:hypothetical protein HPB48_022239 [Haemaphysalis longicornis]|uniref:DDE Tnp4 domain-containing protein n=1 Tax=Haemaphysalis longicornis TaxID=44386 RepID=A0A9J6GB53_HAELO|nr:hypothetical protein HPB48_022239 [Haemaphysalis longicornis]
MFITMKSEIDRVVKGRNPCGWGMNWLFRGRNCVAGDQAARPEPGTARRRTLARNPNCYLASGQYICNVALAYRVGAETAWRSIHVTCRAIWARLKDHFMKGTFSIVLMAVVDSSSKFVLIDVGAEGRHSDGGVFKNAEFRKALTKGQLDIPSLGQLPGTTNVSPYAFVGDEAFQLRRDFMRSCPA